MSRSWRERLEFVDRRVLFLIMAGAITIPLIRPLPLPIDVTPMVRDLYDASEDCLIEIDGFACLAE